MNDLNLETLPDLPQRPLLTELAQDLWAAAPSDIDRLGGRAPNTAETPAAVACGGNGA